jgi:hypothetical protein
MAASIDKCAARSDGLYRALALQLQDVRTDGSSRANLTLAMCTIAMEHGISSRALITLGSLSSAIALLRVQYEAVVRSIWLHYAASEEWIGKLADLISKGKLKEPANALSVSDMLDAIEKTAPPPVCRMLRELKQRRVGSAQLIRTWRHASSDTTASGLSARVRNADIAKCQRSQHDGGDGDGHAVGRPCTHPPDSTDPARLS